jgi:putative NADH-flavin reductase
MNLIVFGASGGCGQWAVKLAVARGWTVTASVRDTTPYEPPNGATVVRGDVLDVAHVTRIVSGHDAILSCLGPQRINPRNPWSGLRSSPAFAARSADVLIAAARNAGIARIGAISAAGVGESAATLNLVMKALLASSTIGVMYGDLADMESRYAASGLDWFAVRPVTLAVDARPSRVACRMQYADSADWLVVTRALP